MTVWAGLQAASPTRPANQADGRTLDGSPVSIHAQVLRTYSLTPDIRRITLGAEEFADFPSAGPDQWIKLFIPRPGQDAPSLPQAPNWYHSYLASPEQTRPHVRTYTVRSLNRTARTLDLDVVLHDEPGPGSTFALTTRPGDWVGLFGPRSAYRPPPHADWQLLLGDETALPAIGAILEADRLPTKVRVETPYPDAQVNVPLGSPSGLTCLVRDPEGSRPGRRILDSLRAADTPAGRPYVWLAGESRMVRDLRRCLVNQHRIDRKDITLIGYWRHGPTGR